MSRIRIEGTEAFGAGQWVGRPGVTAARAWVAHMREAFGFRGWGAETGVAGYPTSFRVAVPLLSSPQVVPVPLFRVLDGSSMAPSGHQARV